MAGNRSSSSPWSPADLQRLAERREAIDAIDRQILRLLSERTGQVMGVGQLKAGYGETVATRAGREIRMLQALIEQNRAQGRTRVADEAILAIWNELIAAATQAEHGFRVITDGRAASLAHARNRFGITTPILSAPDAPAALARVRDEAIEFAVVGLDDPAMLTIWRDLPNLSVLFHLPFRVAPETPETPATPEIDVANPQVAATFSPRDLAGGHGAIVLGSATPERSGWNDWAYALHQGDTTTTTTIAAPWLCLLHDTASDVRLIACPLADGPDANATPPPSPPEGAWPVGIAASPVFG